jgi:transcriptional regulator with XRE-family HTH domain
MKNKKENFASKLNLLFENKRKPDGSHYTQTEVIEGTRRVLTRVYLWKLRKGRASNPGFHVIQVLAGFFGVDPSYFFDSDEMKVALARENLERNKLVDQIALRSSELDDKGKQAVLYMIESIIKSKK